ncbi:Glycosyltransferase, catalytic subunit of cellulose synthase and poly-beta-1,6-N-acetylglucosamine synthase [Paenibacillus sp. UNCCL117]|uniref:glycosyltransferase family 2 protein n=1 Tax=unclassified Paenibacillus TaxID=185978 RepID=UPI0008879556|nr:MULTISPECIES: glycosyltransferase [unclassified Paenibacillus]SDD50142.1 Glycosyltransferase, catalytic subunit of cellulose synthase and poly-beta-1,6-N-acetylglucosamine synthase [Paenibacillus sp. cl123]SFW49785.1 Glycosyltransferase, catalytic subunit of cellulose synthase and poly-beta-1,6-N-acetylglucosamine synthase [Paenibacillus sp. UNCCL117]
MNETWSEWIAGTAVVGSAVIVAYILVVMLFYLMLFIVAFRTIRRDSDALFFQYEEIMHSSFSPPLSILVPAYNEELNIVDSVRSLLGINYGTYEIIVVNDGSKDATKQRMFDEFDMFQIQHQVPWSGLNKETMPVRGIYRSRKHPNLMMADKENGGKADALNAGINLAHYPYVVSLDGDTVLDPNAFLKIMKPIVEAKPGEEIIACGGSVGIANGSVVDRGYLGDGVRLSRNIVVVMQVIEYLRAFLMGRIGLSKMNMLLIVSGAFGVFRKDWLLEAGGYETGTIGEDMELIVRLHRLICKKKSKARIAYIPDPVCWTEAPERLNILKRQRIRWHRGLFESLWRHRGMILNPRYGRIGLIAMPYFLFVELLGPAVELFGYVFLAVHLFIGDINMAFSVLLLAAMILYGSFLSMGAVLLEEWGMGKYNRPADVSRLFWWALSESFWYRPIQTIWRCRGLVQAVRGKRQEWGDMVRKGISVGQGGDGR